MPGRGQRLSRPVTRRFARACITHAELRSEARSQAGSRRVYGIGPTVRFQTDRIDRRTRMSSCEHQTATNRADTRAVTIEATPRSVFEFVANPQNLPYWAVGFCRSIRRDTGDRWVVTTASGEIPIEYELNQAAGTI